MVNIFRRFQQPLLIVLTVFVIIAFVILYGGPGTRLDRLGSDRVATIYGRSVQPVEYTTIGRQFEICRMLGMFDLIIPLAQNARVMSEVTDNYIWNTIVLRTQARKLGIEPTEAQVAEAIQRLPAFQNNGQYDHTRYSQAVQGVLAPRGMGSAQLEEIIRDSLRIQVLKDLLGAGYAPAPDELEAAYVRQYQKVEAALVRVSKEEIAKGVQVPADDVQKAFEARKDTLKSAEKRKVQFVAFTLPEKAKDGPVPAASDLQKVADRADDFSAALFAPDAKFEEVAKRFELEVKTSPLFASGDRLEEFSKQANIAAAAFRITPEKPFSDTLQTEKGYTVLHLVETQAAKPLSLEEARPQLVESLKGDRVREMLSLKAAELRKKIEEGVTAGKTFVQAAEAAGTKAEILEAFSRTESKLKGPDASLIQNAVSELKPGQTSPALDGPDGTLLVHLLKRQPVDPADLEKQKPSMLPMLETQRLDGLLAEWVDRQRVASGLQLAQPR